MLSFWEKEHFLEYDYIIAGSGIVGLSAAASILEKKPESRVAVFERGIFPTGGSTKNAGFACFGSLTELVHDINFMGSETTLDLVKARWEGLKRLRGRLGDVKIDYKPYGGFELISRNESPALKSMEEINELLYPVFHQDVFIEKPHLVSKFGFSQDQIETVVENNFEGQIDTGRMMNTLKNYVRRLGAEIFTGVEVTGYEHSGKNAWVHVKEPLKGKEISFACRTLIFCTSSLTSRFFPQTEIIPGRGQVLVTKPIPGLPFKGTFHFDEGYYYFRDYYERVIFGGGRNLDFKGEETAEIELNEKILSVLEEKLKTIILPGRDFEIEHRWAGIMDFGKTKKPFLEKINGNIIIAGRLSGMGVAIGSLMGENIANLAIE
jgi:glycine/D-amino acid oxidase-like deaminating enzyme